MRFPLWSRSICWKPGTRRKPKYISESQDDCITNAMCTEEKRSHFTMQQSTPSKEKEVLMLWYKTLEHLWASAVPEKRIEMEQIQSGVIVTDRYEIPKLLQMYSDVGLVCLANEDAGKILVYKLMWW